MNIALGRNILPALIAVGLVSPGLSAEKSGPAYDQVAIGYLSQKSGSSTGNGYNLSAQKQFSEHLIGFVGYGAGKLGSSYNELNFGLGARYGLTSTTDALVTVKSVQYAQGSTSTKTIYAVGVVSMISENVEVGLNYVSAKDIKNAFNASLAASVTKDWALRLTCGSQKEGSTATTVTGLEAVYNF